MFAGRAAFVEVDRPAGVLWCSLPASEFDERNAAGIAALSHLAGPDVVVRFLDRAQGYLERAVGQWNRPYGFPLGTVTVGHHVGVAAAEWHLHAWDLSAGLVDRHEPAAADALIRAVGAAIAEAQGGVRGRATALVVPLASRRSPWKTVLTASGRSAARRRSSAD